MELSGKTIALLATNGFEDDELTEPLEVLKQAGALVRVISEESGTIKGKNDTTIHVDVLVSEADQSDYEALLLPGGVENPDKLRMNAEAVSFVKTFFDDDKPVAAICHAPWLLVEANVVEGRTVTSWPSLKTDLENAGALWVDKEVVVDRNLVTSRNPGDILAFSAKAIEVISNKDVL
jgi:protease I